MTTPLQQSRIELPPPPNRRRPGTAVAWAEPLTIDTYLPEHPDRYPSFFKNRVYQGSSGRVYPLPFHERIDARKRPHQWQAIHLENDWLRVVVLPELGGRIHVAYDKGAGYDIFYRNNVIKPALVGLAGPWISGGVEFNWPQHHRPATFLPTDYEIVAEEDGSVIVWCSDHDPFTRMKGMHGVRLRPDSSRIEVDVRLYNRDDRPQTFLWWANVAAAVHDDYQSFFPPDVRWVADHAKRATVTFPQATSAYYGIDYPERRARLGEGADCLDWYKNIPVPTSYMALDTRHEFFGGYDHARGAGFVHWAPREISPGKKQWTWGNAPFGQAWDRNLTDDDGPYVELMAGVFTDNQPDFAYLAPGETKTFRQSWYPIRDIGPVTAANEVLAANLIQRGADLVLGLTSSETVDALDVLVIGADGAARESHTVSLKPAEPWTATLDRGFDPARVEIRRAEQVLLTVERERATAAGEAPAPAVAPPAPAEVETIDELVYIAAYLTQYRHATRSPMPYWHEALRRDPGESRALLGLAWQAYDAADHATALRLAEASIQRRTRWAPTPQSGEAHYLAGLAAERAGDDERARIRYGRAAWDHAFAAAAGYRLARLELRGGDSTAAERVLRRVIESAPGHLQARNLLAVILTTTGRADEAADLVEATRTMDPLDAWSRHLAGARPITRDATIALDIALEYAGAGCREGALELLDIADELAPRMPSGQVDVTPMIAYHRAAVYTAARRPVEALAEWRRAETLGAGSCLPSRLDDIAALRNAVGFHPQTALARLLLGDWHCHVRDFASALQWWSEALAAGLASGDAAVAHRNLAVVTYNHLGEGESALHHYEAALRHRPMDAKLVYERDQLAARLGHDAGARFEWLRSYEALVGERDDLVIAWVNLLVDLDRATEALNILRSRRFQPWEGGEGLAVAAWERVCTALSRAALATGDAEAGWRYAEMARDLPEHLGEERHPLANVARLELLLGDAAAARGRVEEARQHWERAAASISDFTSMAVTPFSIMTIDSITALQRLERTNEAREVVERMRSWLDERGRTPAEIDYFATSLPTMLLFDSDPEHEREAESHRIRTALAQVDQALV